MDSQVLLTRRYRLLMKLLLLLLPKRREIYSESRRSKAFKTNSKEYSLATLRIKNRMNIRSSQTLLMLTRQRSLTTP